MAALVASITTPLVPHRVIVLSFVCGSFAALNFEEQTSAVSHDATLKVANGMPEN
jgi:hypothetical protein